MSNTIVLSDYKKSDYATTEAYNSLRTNLKFSGNDLKVFLLTSCLPNEGKSTVSFQLAQSMAEEGKKVVFVDGDLRKSVTLGRYKVSAENKKIGGLSHHLSGQAERDEIVCETNIPNLSIVLTGPVAPNPTELLGNKTFGDLIKSLRGRFDAVVIDAPPLGAVIDAAVIAPHCDGVILVVESGIVSYRLAQNVKKQLEVTGCKTLGVVLNKFKKKNSRYYGRYYGKYYGKSE